MNSGGGNLGGFNEAEIRAAERGLEQALQSSDPTAWVYSYTEDAIFVAPGAPAVQSRAALRRMTRAMKPLSSVSIPPIRTEGSGGLATVYGHGYGSSGARGSASPAPLGPHLAWCGGFGPSKLLSDAQSRQLIPPDPALA